MKEEYKDITNVLDISKIKFDEPMSHHTTLKVGGTADIFVMPESIEEIKACIEYAKTKCIPVTIIGNGSKLLVLDGGIRGMVIKLASKFSEISIDGEKITVYAGVTLPYLARIVRNNSLTGLEFACGIPAAIGGAIFQNAGAYGSEMANIVEQVTYLDENNELQTKMHEELEFGYRSSFFKKNKDKGYIIISAVLKLSHGKIDEIEAKMNENTASRREKQPLEYPSAGSTFKRPQGYFVGKLIDDAGLKGKAIGGAQISNKHSGFIVNINKATAKDVKNLIDYTKQEIYTKFGVKLEEEIIIMGDEI